MVTSQRLIFLQDQLCSTVEVVFLVYKHLSFSCNVHIIHLSLAAYLSFLGATSIITGSGVIAYFRWTRNVLAGLTDDS